MSLYLPVQIKGSAAIAICPRCQKKVPYDSLVQDPNNKMWVCKDDQDLYDPWRLPARRPKTFHSNTPALTRS